MRHVVALAAAALLAGCGGRYAPVSDTPVRIGKPYSVRGITYIPTADPTYDMLGMASWYGSESGDRTANGERFRAKAIAGAHTTLPLPSYVEVTSLDTGRVIVLRVNDRGPFAAGRIIDLSRGAADLLGIRAQGQAAVRVRVVDPPEADKARLRAGKSPTPRPDVTPAVRANLRAQLENGLRAMAEQQTSPRP
ncbi:MAG: septal ring lytic transglycosylase RlpA family protein [Sphingomonas adhaesiva]|uniref:septal ring lytic transglycosylase RlpA family protein n=1 Tax=Sphingomonas adhaesiva TaxID=28212 RepID=UPI002FFC8E2F